MQSMINLQSSKKPLALVFILCVLLSGLAVFEFASPGSSVPEAKGAVTPLNVDVAASMPAPYLLNVGESVTFSANVSIPTHEETYRNWHELWLVLHTRMVPDYDISLVSYVWQLSGSAAWSLASNGSQCILSSVEISTEPASLNVTVLYGGGTVLGSASVVVESASQPKTLQVALETPKGESPKLAVELKVFQATITRD